MLHSTSSHNTRPECPSEQTGLRRSTSVYPERDSFDAIRCNPIAAGPRQKFKTPTEDA
jgi:hypothetical protein